MAFVGNLWKRFRASRVHHKRSRRLFMEPLESRNLLAAQLTVGKTDGFPMGVRAGEQNLTYTITIQNTGDVDATDISLIDSEPAHTSSGSLTVADTGDTDTHATVTQNPFSNPQDPTDDRAKG